MSEWKVREMSALLEEIRYMRERLQVIYEACGASCGNSVHIHRCMTPKSQGHEAHICEDCGYEWTQTEAAEVRRREHGHGTPTFDILAAVEDWQKRQDIGGDWGTVAWSVRMYQHYVTSEAAIARVRIEHRSDMAGIPWCYACDASWPCDTIRALDGDA